MGAIAREHWVVQPLLEAGLGLDEVGDLVFRLAFDDVVGAGRGTAAELAELVADRPVAVRAAWAQTVGRLHLLVPPS